MSATLADVLARETREGDLYDTLPDGRLRCYACGHCCPLPDGAIGVCKVASTRAAGCCVPWGYVGGVQCDPIEKKPFFHALSRARSPTASACSAAICTAAIARTG